MTPEERGLIEGLFDRMVRYGAPEMDREAEALINQRVRALPDAVYMLTQSVLVQEQALEAANARAVGTRRPLARTGGEWGRTTPALRQFPGRRVPKPRPRSPRPAEQRPPGRCARDAIDL